MELSLEDQARIKDSTHNIQAASESLQNIDSRKIPDVDDIKSCLAEADQTLRSVLRRCHDTVREIDPNTGSDLRNG